MISSWQAFFYCNWRRSSILQSRLCVTSVRAAGYGIASQIGQRRRRGSLSYCPRCGKAMETDRFNAICASCGTSVQLPCKSSGIASFTRPDSNKKADPTFCLRCGARIRSSNKFCDQCSNIKSEQIPTIY